jgi:FlaA1/EpsC-like NDP-sugar epimerase
MGVPVAGNRHAMAEVVRRFGADAVLIAIPSANAELVRELTELAEPLNVDLKVVPPVVELFGRTVSVEDIRPVSHADLLGRREIGIDLAAWPATSRAAGCWSPGPAARSARSCAARSPGSTRPSW